MQYFLYFLSFLYVSLFAFEDVLGQEVLKNTPIISQTNQVQLPYGVEKKQSTEYGLLTKDKGISPLYETIFGTFRLISCDGGIPKTNQLFLMIEAKIKDGWKLQKPLIPYETKKNSFLKEDIFYPINQWAVKRTRDYEKESYFALLYTLNEDTQIFTVKKEVAFTACQKEKCETKTIPLELTLDRSYAYPTDVCAMMLQAFQKIPMPPQQNELKAQLRKLDDNHLQLFLDFNRDINRIDIQIETDEDWILVKKELHDNQAMLLIKSNKLTQLDKASIKLLTSLGAFDLNLAIEQGVWKSFKSELSVLKVLESGFLLFLLSPLFLLFLCLPGTKKELHQKVKLIKYGISFVAGILAILGYFYIDIFNLFEIKNWNIVFAFLALVYLLYKPNISLGWAIVFFFLLPKPYLMDVLYALESGTFSIFFVFASWAFISYLPFNMTKNMPKLFKELKKVKQYPYLLRLPQVVLLIWLFVAFIGHFAFDKSDVSSKELLPQQNQITYVSIENGYCVRCLLNKWSFRYMSENTNLLLNKKTKIVSLNIDSFEKEFLSENHIERATYGLLYGTNVPYPVILYGYVSLDEWPSYLKNVTDIADINKQFVAGKDGEH